MHNTTCLNCDTELTGKFCHECGQKADTHRITGKHFIMHDLVHGIWHIDKGIPYTLKQAVVRPGYAISDYIKGKRVRMYNIFYLMLMVIAFILYLGVFMGIPGEHSFSTKATYLTFIPLYAGAGWLMFRRLKYNFFEHMVVAGMIVLCMLMLILLKMPFEVSLSEFSHLDDIFFGLYLIPPIISYYQICHKFYKFFGFVWRVIVVLLLVMVAQFLWAYLFSLGVYWLS